MNGPRLARKSPWLINLYVRTIRTHRLLRYHEEARQERRNPAYAGIVSLSCGAFASFRGGIFHARVWRYKKARSYMKAVDDFDEKTQSIFVLVVQLLFV